MPASVLIATPEHLVALTQRSDLAGAVAFPDGEALRALEAITREPPSLVALDKAFATTSRGAALINRIKADPSLTSCEIRVLGHDEPATPAASAASPALPTPAPATAPTGGPAAGTAPLTPLDYRGTRRVPRFRMNADIEVAIDGNPATLVDLSLMGAMVVSATILRPNQRVRMALPDPARPLRFSAGVAWAAFELLKTGPRYRAGIEFFDADSAAVQRFIDANQS